MLQGNNMSLLFGDLQLQKTRKKKIILIRQSSFLIEAPFSKDASFFIFYCLLPFE